MGDDEGYAAAARDFGIEHVKDVECGASRLPLVNSMVRIAEARARNELMLYVAADTLLFDDLVAAAGVVRKRFEKFCIVAGRHHIRLDEPIDFGAAGWADSIRARATGTTRDDIMAGDVFLYSRGLWGEIPAFSEGRTAVDNWLHYRTLERKGALVDATPAVMTLHQDHDYSHHPQGVQGVFYGADASENRRLAGGSRQMLNRDSANWMLDASGLRRPPGFLLRRLRTWRRARV